MNDVVRDGQGMRGGNRLGVPMFWVIQSILVAMKSFIVGVFILLSFLSIATAADRYPWMSDLDEAREKAAREQKPLLIAFRCEP